MLCTRASTALTCLLLALRQLYFWPVLPSPLIVQALAFSLHVKSLHTGCLQLVYIAYSTWMIAQTHRLPLKLGIEQS